MLIHKNQSNISILLAQKNNRMLSSIKNGISVNHMDSDYEIGRVERRNQAFKRGMSFLLSKTMSEGDMDIFRLQNPHNISNKY
jgi:hypothetical protein